MPVKERSCKEHQPDISGETGLPDSIIEGVTPEKIQSKMETTRVIVLVPSILMGIFLY
jgi:hypothetical protein